MLEKYKDDQEFYSLVGIKPQTFHKMVEILKIAEFKQKYYGGRKNKLVIVNLVKKKKYIKINYNELVHQNLLIKWLSQQNDIISYQTEKELKTESPREQGYPDLLVHYEDKEMIIEFERTRKSKNRFENKLDTYYRDLQNGKEILWLVPNESMKKFVDEQIKSYNWKLDKRHIEVFNDS